MLQYPLKQELQIPTMGKEDLENEEWLTKVFRKSKSDRSKAVAKTALKSFNFFCQAQGVKETADIELGFIPEMMKQYNVWYNPKPNPEVLVRPDIDSICKSFDKFLESSLISYETNDEGEKIEVVDERKIRTVLESMALCLIKDNESHKTITKLIQKTKNALRKYDKEIKEKRDVNEVEKLNREVSEKILSEIYL